MAAVTIHLPSATEQTIRERASREGKSLESFLQDLVAQAALGANGADLAPSPNNPPIAELDRWLDDLAAGLPSLPTLPADFSRADLYAEHD
jgi:hypothetical protein